MSRSQKTLIDRTAEQLTYQGLVNRYGTPMAFDLLISIEKLAKIKSGTILYDEETRFQRAWEILNKESFDKERSQDLRCLVIFD